MRISPDVGKAGDGQTLPLACPAQPNVLASPCLLPLLEALRGERRLVRTTGFSGSYVIDHRTGQRQVVAAATRPAPGRHEVDDVVTVTCAAALESTVLASFASGEPSYAIKIILFPWGRLVNGGWSRASHIRSRR